VVPLGVDPQFFRLQRAAAGPFLLSVSTLHPHKNLERLLHAFRDFRRMQPEYRLIVAGLKGFRTEALYQLRESLGLTGSVEFTGWIARAELLNLFASASAFIFPSTFEGFGLPLVEALAAGLPTACSNIEPLASIAGDAALRFDPNDTAALCQAMVRITSDPQLRERLTAEGPQRAAAFSWDVTARATVQALSEAGQRTL
jgi:glycosyltransferase involved in cell wall biosynthesis